MAGARLPWPFGSISRTFSVSPSRVESGRSFSSDSSGHGISPIFVPEASTSASNEHAVIYAAIWNCLATQRINNSIA